MKQLLFITGALTLFTLGMLLGYMNPALSAEQPELGIYEKYNHIRIYEDGSFEGQNRAGAQVTGCIDTAQCNNE